MVQQIQMTYFGMGTCTCPYASLYYCEASVGDNVDVAMMQDKQIWT